MPSRVRNNPLLLGLQTSRTRLAESTALLKNCPASWSSQFIATISYVQATALTTMSAPRAITALARTARLQQRHATSIRASAIASRAAFSSSARINATTEGAPPAGFRATRPPRWNERKDSVWDQAGNYFLLTEMLRGMYVVLEQFFRPPYV